MELETAWLLWGRLLWQADLDLLGSTTLGVLDNASVLAAGLLLLAERSVRHIVLELNLGILIRSDLELLDREALGLVAEA